MNEPERIYQGILQKYNVKTFKDLTVKQRTEILQALSGSKICAASGRKSKFNEQEKTQRIANGSEQGDNVFDRGKEV